MTDLINGRTPEEIKRNLSYLVRCENCPQNHEYGCDYDKQTKECRTVIDALALIEHLEAKVPKWISVEERLPECPCLYWDGTNQVRVAETVTSIKLTSGKTVYLTDVTFNMLLDIAHSTEGWDDCTRILYWLPLPKPPKGEEE